VSGPAGDREHAHRKEGSFQNAPGCGFDPFGLQLSNADQDRRYQHDRCHAIRDAEVAPFDPVVGSKVIGDGEGGAPERSPHRDDDHRDQDEEDGFAKADEMKR
jgi:hypothetical protein